MLKSLKARQLIPVVIILAFASVALLLVFRFTFDRGNGSPEQDDGADAVAVTHSLSDAESAEFLTVFVYDEGGMLVSLMVGGSTEEFSSIAAAVAGASPAEGVIDDTFSDLLVFSFGEGDTMEVPYSRARDLLFYENQLLTPASELPPVIDSVEKRLS